MIIHIISEIKEMRNEFNYFSESGSIVLLSSGAGVTVFVYSWNEINNVEFRN